MADTKISTEAEMESPEKWKNAESHKNKDDAISRQVFWMALITHLGKRNSKTDNEDKTCVFSPNVIALAWKYFIHTDVYRSDDGLAQVSIDRRGLI